MLLKIFKDIGIAGIGEVFYIITLYGTNLIISRHLGAEGIGIYAQAMTIVLLIALSTRLGFDMGILRFISKYLAQGDHEYLKGIMSFATWLILLVSIFLTAIVFVAADFLANNIFHEPGLTYVLRALSLSIPFLALTPLWLNAIQAFHQTVDRVVIGRIVVPVVTFGTMVLFLYLGWGWNGVLSSVLMATTIGAVLAFKKYHHIQNLLPSIAQIKPKFASKEWLRFSLPIYFSDLLVLTLARGTILVLGFFQSSAEVGVYEIALKVALLVRLPLDISNLIFAPIIGEIYTQGDILKLQSLFRVLTKWLFAISVLIFLLTVALAEPILHVFGPEFVAGTAALSILAFGYLVNVSTGSAGLILIMSGYAKIHMINSIISVLLTLVFGLMLIPKYGFVGAAITVGLVEILINMTRVVEVFHLLKIHPYRWDFIKPVTAGALTLAMVYLLQQWVPYWSNSTFWSSTIIAGSICMVYLVFSTLLHWNQIKEPRSLLL